MSSLIKFNWPWKKEKFLTSVQNDISVTGNTTPRWIDVNRSKLWNLYTTIPHLNTVINRKAMMMSNMVIRHYDRNDNELFDTPALKLLNKPNVLTDRDNFIMDLSVSRDVYANNFIYENLVAKSDPVPVSMWGLSPDLMSLKLTGKSLDQIDIAKVVEKYKIDRSISNGEFFGREQEFDPTEIIHIKNNNKVTDVIGTSKLEALRMPLSNLQAAYEARNILINERGAIGVLSAESKDGIPINEKEKELVDDAINAKYGITGNKKTKIITSGSFKWQPMNFDVNQLQLFEEVDDDFRAIADAYGLIVDIFSTKKGATFENQREAMRSVYQNTIIPEGNMFINEFSNAFALPEKGEYLVADYSAVPTLQENILEMNKSKKDLIAAMEGAWRLVEANAITVEQFNKMFDL